MTRRWLGSLVLLACTPHEHPREPQAPCPVGMTLVEAGGAPRVDRQCVDLTEVTTAAYGACVHAGACTPASVGSGEGCNLTRADRGEHPINCVGLEQARAYCGWLGKRLPSDIEWAWIARPRDPTSTYPWGDAPPDDHRACARRGALGTCPVGQFPRGASADGVLDLAGNVAEWTVDDAEHLRGGSWSDEPALDFRGDQPQAASTASGLRCVVAPFTAVDAVDLDVWTPHVPGVVELPVLAAPAPRHAPVRPLANLSLLGHDDSRAATERWWPVGDAWLPGELATPELGLADLVDRAVMPEALRDLAPVHRLGDVLLMRAGWSSSLRFVAVERATHKVRWQIAFANHGGSYLQLVTPRTLVAQVYGQQSDAIVGFGLADGREVWRLRGGDDQKFTRMKHMWQGGERVYVHGDRGLLAFDPVNGAILWSDVLVGDGCGIAGDADGLVVEDPGREGHRRLDPATGAELGRIAHTGGECRWSRDRYEGGVTAGVLEDRRMFAFDTPVKDGAAATLRAFDITTGRELWRRAGLDPDVLLADHDAVYAARADETLVALDAATGAPQVEISLAETFNVQLLPGGGPRGPLLLAVGQAGHSWLLGRSEQPSAPETYVVRGRLVPDGLSRRQVANVPVRAGERRVRSDAGGRFEVRGVARGAVAVALGTDKGPRERGGSSVRFEPVTVVLDGRGTYDVGEVPLYQWYVE